MFGLLNNAKQNVDSEELFERICKDKIFSSITYFYITNMIANIEKITFSSKIALGYIFEISLQGFLFLRIEQDKIIPKPSTFISQKQLSIEPELLKEVEMAILEGIHQSPKELMQSIESHLDIFPTKPFCKKDNRYYIQRNWIYESQFYKCLHERSESIPTELDKDVIDEKLQGKLQSKKISSHQADAIKLSLENSFSLICGGPGCGKTYSILHLIDTFMSAWRKKRIPQVILAAPTGKAAQKLEETVESCFDVEKVSIEIMTLHALLKIKKDESKYLERKLIDADLIIIDEASMIDIRLMAHLLMGLPGSSRLVLLGDPNQLPPIETEGIFSIVAKNHCDLAFVSYLTEAFRFENNRLIQLANSIRDQNIEKVLKLLKGNNAEIEFFSMENQSNKDILEEIMRKVTTEDAFSSKGEINTDHILSRMFSFRILSCLKKGPLGSDDINQRCKEYFLEKAASGDKLFLPIIITQNDYQLNLYNGTLGFVIQHKTMQKIDQGNAYFSSKKKYPLFMLPQYEYSYCLSVHKSQGSEFDHVMLIIPPASEVFSKEILYTAVTRAKKKLTIISSEETIRSLIKKASV